MDFLAGSDGELIECLIMIQVIVDVFDIKLSDCAALIFRRQDASSRGVLPDLTDTGKRNGNVPT